MNGKKALPILIVVVTCCFLAVLPSAGSPADLTISNIMTSTGNWSVNGIINATSFGGNGSGLTNVTASGLSCTGCVSLPQINPSQVQSRIGSNCAAGSSIRAINSDGTVVCQTDTNSGGTVTSVGTGAGLTGGPITTTGTLSVNYGGNGSATTVARSDHSHDAVYQKKYSKVAVVDLNGKGDYTDPATAMADYQNWCGTPYNLSPCLLKMMPGYYYITTNSVLMRGYIDIEGSGEHVTVISGTIDSSSSGVVAGDHYSELRFLTVENTGGGTNAIAIYGSPSMSYVTARASYGSGSNYGVYNDHSLCTMRNVTAFASGGSSSYGVYNDSASPTLSNVSASAYGGSNSYGVYNNNAHPTMDNVTAFAETNAGGNDYAVYNNSSYPTMRNVTATAWGVGDINAYGVYNKGSQPNMRNISIEAFGANYCYGVYNSQSSNAIMRNMDVFTAGDIYSIYNYGILNDAASTMKLINVDVQADPYYVSDSFGLLNTSTGGDIHIDHSNLSGKRSIRNDNSSAHIYVGSSKLDGDVLGPVNVSGTIKCVGVYNGSYSAISCP